MNVLLVIDMQNDFIDGALGTPEAEKIVEIHLSDTEKAQMQESAQGVKATNGLLEL